MKNNSLLALSLIVLFASACKKDLETGAPTETQPPSWEIANGFSGNFKGRVYNSMIFNDQLYALTFNTIAEVREDGSAMHYGGMSSEKTEIKLPFTSKFLARIVDDKWFSLETSPRPNGKIQGFNIDSFALGANFGSFNSQYFMAANNSGQLFILANQDGSIKREVPILLDVQVVQGTYEPSIGKVKRIPIDFPQEPIDLVSVNALGDNFLVSYFLGNNELYTALVAPDGSYQVVAENMGLLRVFKRNNTWYALGRKPLDPYTIHPDFLYHSNNEGQSWELVGTITQTASAAGLTLPSSFTSPILGAAEGVNRTYLYTSSDIFSFEEDEAGKPIFRKAKLEFDTRINTIAEWRNKVFVMGPKGVQFMNADDFELLLEDM
jgi:hypothetical protein